MAIDVHHNRDGCKTAVVLAFPSIPGIHLMELGLFRLQTEKKRSINLAKSTVAVQRGSYFVTIMVTQSSRKISSGTSVHRASGDGIEELEVIYKIKPNGNVKEQKNHSEVSTSLMVRLTCKKVANLF